MSARRYASRSVVSITRLASFESTTASDFMNSAGIESPVAGLTTLRAPLSKPTMMLTMPGFGRLPERTWQVVTNDE